MKPPIFVTSKASTEDVLCFSTVEHARGYLEAVDVRDEEYTLFDSEGRLVRATAASDYGPVSIEGAEAIPTHQASLRQALISYLSALGGPSAGVVDAPLDDLVSRTLPYRIR